MMLEDLVRRCLGTSVPRRPPAYRPGLVWSGLVWSGLVWSGLVWSGWPV